MVDRQFVDADEKLAGLICPVCGRLVKVGEKVVLVPVQALRRGFGRVKCTPVHGKCYWVGVK